MNSVSKKRFQSFSQKKRHCARNVAQKKPSPVRSQLAVMSHRTSTGPTMTASLPATAGAIDSLDSCFVSPVVATIVFFDGRFLKLYITPPWRGPLGQVQNRAPLLGRVQNFGLEDYRERGCGVGVYVKRNGTALMGRAVEDYGICTQWRRYEATAFSNARFCCLSRFLLRPEEAYRARARTIWPIRS